MELTDTHCHIHSAAGAAGGEQHTMARWAAAGDLKPDDILQESVASGVTRLICVGCTAADSQLAVAFAGKTEQAWASIGIHPHDAANHLSKTTLEAFRSLAQANRVVAVGECGLDYYYEHSPKKDQEQLLRFQLDLASEYKLPLIFHVRDAFDDFWPIYDQYSGLKGVIHSFSAGRPELEQILARGLYVGLNGIMTFTKNPEQLLAAKAIPLQNLLLETDAPFLTPAPYRGTICQPKHVVRTAEFLAGLREEDMATLAQATTQNACNLFGF